MMERVKNRKPVRTLAYRTLTSAKGKTAAAVSAVILTAVMFTALFTITGSLLSKTQEETMRQVGGSSHAGFKYLTQEEYDIVKADKELKEVSYRITVGYAANEELKKLQTEAGWYEDRDAEMSFCYPYEGRMPQAENEIVTSDLVLEALGVPVKTGETVRLEIAIADKVIAQDFVVSGIYKGDTVAMAQILAVSKPFQEKYAPVAEKSVLKTGPATEDDYVGRIMADFNFKSSSSLNEKAAALCARCGFPDTTDIGINWAYMSLDLDMETVLLEASFLVVFFLSGYLIIYNIFYISVYADIRRNGLLKTIGATGRQLKRMVRIQADVLSLIGIPIGLVLGAFVGKVILPVLMSMVQTRTATDDKIVLNPLFFLAAAVFSWLTVRISCMKPCRMAASVTPIEALRTVEAGRQRKKQKKTRRVSPFSMAAGNMRRNRGRAAVVVLSLSLALVVLNAVFGVVQGFDLDKYIANMAVSDYMVTDASILNSTIWEKEMEGVSKEFLAELEKQDGIKEKSNVYALDYYPQFTEEDWKKIDERVISSEEYQTQDTTRMDAEVNGMSVEEWVDFMRTERPIDSFAFGIGELVFHKLERVDGALDWEKFKSGGYVITGWYGYSDEGAIAYFHPGEKVTVFNEQGESREYEVMASAEIPYAAGPHVGSLFNCNYILPEEEFLDFIGARQPLSTLFNTGTGEDADKDIDKAIDAEMEAWLEDYCGTIETDLAYKSKGEIAAEFSDFVGVFEMVGSATVFLLMLIGLLNFSNTMITSIIAKKQELAMMEAVGMTVRQQKMMLIWEGCFYAAGSIALSLVLGSVLNATAVRTLGESFFFYTWHFTVWPIAVCIPAVFIIVAFVPSVCYQWMRKDSVVERIRLRE